MKSHYFVKYAIIFISCLLILSSCTMRLSTLPKLNIAGPKITENKLKISDYQIVDKAAKAEDFFPIVILFPIYGNNQENIEGMINNAVVKLCKKRNFKFMTNVKIYQEAFYIPYIYGEIHIKIEGEGWTEKSSAMLYYFDIWEKSNFTSLYSEDK